MKAPAKNTNKKSLKGTVTALMVYVYTFFQQTDAQFGQDPGHSPDLLFQDLNVFTALSVPSASASPGDTLTITGDHTFPMGSGFINLSTYRDGAEVNGKSAGEPGFQIKDNSLTFVIVGDSAVIKEKAENMKNRPLIFLVRDPQPGSVRYQQLGTAENPCVVTAVEQTSGNKTKGGTKGYKITVAAVEQIYDYQGTIVLNS